MANLGEFGSLLQLGVGIGIGLSVFRAPFEILSRKFDSDLKSEFNVLASIATAHAAERRAVLSDLALEFDRTSKALERFHLPFMIASILGAGVNWYYLAEGAWNAACPLSPLAAAWLTFMSGPFFLLIFASVTAITFFSLRPLRAKLDAERTG
ncbi:hypothetical protein [Bradyrhizobium diazoefficiens]